MKKIGLISLLIISIIGLTNAQVFNTSSTLKKKQFSVGIEPAFLINGDEEFYLFLHGGAGIASGVDLGLKFGVLGDETYIGGDIEFALGKRFSLAAGAHSFYDFGLDATALFTFPIVKSADIYTGLDMDINFEENDTEFPVWIPVGVQIGMKQNLVFLFEAEINVTDVGYHFFGGGVNFFF